MDQLKVHVESIVRPVRAAVGRKNKMREELLAHLTEKARALMAAGADEPSACVEAIQQLGDPVTLRADLQATVPAVERLAFLRLPDIRVLDAWFERTEETPFRFALVRTFYTALGIGAVLLVLLLAASLGLLPTRHRHINPLSYCAVLFGVSYASVVLSSFVSYYLVDVTGLRRLMSKETPVSAWLKSGALCLFMCVNVALIIVPIDLFMRMIHPEEAAFLATLLVSEVGREIALGAVLFLLTAFIFCGVAMKFERNQWLKWGSLRIDE
jgi:hypothetical protein